MAKDKQSIGLYAGSFDPITKGHLDVLGKALRTFDQVYLAIGYNANKKRTFSERDSLGLLGSSLKEHFGFDGKWTSHSGVQFFDGELPLVDVVLDNADSPVHLALYRSTIIDFAKSVGATHIVRGLRQAGDFNDEFNLAGVASHLDSNIIFTHFICREEFLHISSSTARELAKYGSDISWLVTPSVEQALKEKLGPKNA